VTACHFGVSTHLFHDQRLTGEHIEQIASHGFGAIELVTDRSHFDYRDVRAIDALAGWLRERDVTLHSLHAPHVELDEKGRRAALSTAAGDESRRTAAVEAICATLEVARRIPFRFLVLHLGVVSTETDPAHDNRPEAARRSLEEIAHRASEFGVRVAVEVIPNALSQPEALVRLIEEDLDGLDVGICLDYGHAHLMGDLSDAIEALSGYLWTTHVHDNRRQRDEHLVPFAGTINWDAAVMETQKVGYDDVLMLELAGGVNPADALERSVKARERLGRAFITF